METCEICHKKKNYIDNIHIGLDLGFHIGDYNKEYREYYRQKPRCISVHSIYLCRDCQEEIKKDNGVFFNDLNIMPMLKKLIKGELVKKMLIESLKDGTKI